MGQMVEKSLKAVLLKVVVTLEIRTSPWGQIRKYFLGRYAVEYLIFNFVATLQV